MRKSPRDIAKDVLPVGTEITLTFKVAAYPDEYEDEVQLQSEDGLLTYFPARTVLEVGR